MAAVNYAITGPPAPSPAPADGSLPLRIELRDLQANYPDLWNLYLLALQAFYQLDETSDLSFYGIAGIHGRPYRPWGGVTGSNPSPLGWQGYCTHTSILFAPWHRPYLALYEQVLYGIVQNIAASFPPTTRARYQEAASTFRIPYWDWAAQPPSGDQYFPNSVGGSATVDVITPESNGQIVQIDNPLYTYRFKPINPQAKDFPFRPYSQWQTTLRYPTSSSSPNAESQDDQVFDAMASQFQSFQSNINLLMNDPNYKVFDSFSNHTWQVDEPGTFASLEDVHNSIHGEIGGSGGQMSDPDYAAFDPVFWLHHVNVDRLFAIWQALNPSSYTINKPAGDGTFVIANNSVETAQTPLTPFHDASGTKYWDSQGVRTTAKFNYAYPETQRWKFAADDAYIGSVQAAVQNLYGDVSNQFMLDQGVNLMATPAEMPAAPATITTAENGSATFPISATVKAAAQQHPVGGDGTTSPPHSSGKHPIDEMLGKVKQNLWGKSGGQTDLTRSADLESEIGKDNAPPKAGKYTEYICNIRTRKHCLQQTYRVHIFLGPFDPETRTWHTQEALVGTFVVLGKNPEMTGCGKCKKDEQNNVMITGTVPLTSALLNEYKAGRLGGMGKENVLPWLTDNLHWRVTIADGTDKPRDEVEGLKISVVTTEVALPVGGFPTYSGVYEVHPEVTEGRPAGFGSGDQV